MLHIVLVLAGMALGALASGPEGVLLGLLTGLALAESLRLGRLITQQRRELDQVHKELAGLKAQVQGLMVPASVAPEVVETAPTEAAAPLAVDETSLTPQTQKMPGGEPVTPLTETVVAAAEAAPSVIDASIPPQTAPQPAVARGSQKAVGAIASRRIERPAAAPSPVEALFNRFLEQTNWVTRIGLVILFFGVAFLLKFAAEHVSISMPARLLGVAIGALAAFVFGWRLLGRQRGYGLLLQGGAIGVAYMDVYAAMRLYHLITPGTGFFLLLLVSVLAATSSVLLDAMVLAVFGILGGFLAPVLTSSGGGSHVMLFTYYAILNAGIVAIVWHKAWRPLTLLGFAFTFVIGVLWGVTQYKPEFFASTEPFLLLFWAFYLLIAVLFAWHKRWDYRAVLDGPIVFGTPAIGLVLQHALVRDVEYGMAWSTFGIGVVYLALAWFYQFRLMHRDLMSESLWAIGIVILSLTIPFACDDDLTATFWALEAAGGIWLGTRQQRPWGIALAILALLGAGVSWMADDLRESGEYLILNTATFNGWLIALAGLFGAWVLQREQVRLWGVAPAPLVLVWALLWWFGIGIWQLDEHLTERQFAPALLLFVCFSAGWIRWLGHAFNWESLLRYLVGFSPVFLLTALFAVFPGEMRHPLRDWGWLAWPLGFAMHLWILQSLFRRWHERPFMAVWHGGGLLLAVALLSWEAVYRIDRLTHLFSWLWMGAGLFSLVGLWAVLRLRFWADAFDAVYRVRVAGVLVALLVLNSLVCNVIQPNLAPMSYVPLLNALDLWQIACLASAVVWWRRLGEMDARRNRIGFGILGVAVFLFLNAMLLRTLHRFWQVPFNGHGMFHSDLVQTCLAIFWALLGIVLMVWASRRLSRLVWSVGCALLGVVVLKLFVVDLANTGTIARIVSFMGVGGLLLAVGYFVPLPTAHQAESGADHNEV